MMVVAKPKRDSEAGPNADGRLRSLIEQLPDGIVVIDDAGVVRFANPAALALFGRPAGEILGGEFGYPLVVDGPPEIELLRRGGELVYAELRLVETEWAGAPAKLVSLRDITDRKQAEERERQLQEERMARAAAEAAANVPPFCPKPASSCHRLSIMRAISASSATWRCPHSRGCAFFISRTAAASRGGSPAQPPIRLSRVSPTWPMPWRHG